MLTADIDKIAEVVLYEGYMLFPYTRSAIKNQQRWTFGGVYPRAYSEATGGDDPWAMQTQCLVAGNNDTRVEIQLRFLQVADRNVFQGNGSERLSVSFLQHGDEIYYPLEEAMERRIIAGPSEEGGDRTIRLGDLMSEPRTFAIDIASASQEEVLFGENCIAVGTLVRETGELRGEVEVLAEPAFPGIRITVRVRNHTPCGVTDTDAKSRSEALRHTFVSTHTILHVMDGEFISLLEPEDAFRDAAQGCENVKTWPVLVGDRSKRHTMLSSPIILYDYPEVSPESRGNYFDATEIDELLALTVMTLTDEEKQEMRDSGAQSLGILERTEALTPEQLSKLHGGLRYLDTNTRARAAT